MDIYIYIYHILRWCLPIRCTFLFQDCSFKVKKGINLVFLTCCLIHFLFAQKAKHIVNGMP